MSDGLSYVAPADSSAMLSRKVERKYNLSAHLGIKGRNSDNNDEAAFSRRKMMKY